MNDTWHGLDFPLPDELSGEYGLNHLQLRADCYIMCMISLIAGIIFAWAAVELVATIHNSVYPLCRGAGGVFYCRGYETVFSFQETDVLTSARLGQDQKLVLFFITTATSILSLSGWLVIKIVMQARKH
jgi:hypothetical protein